MSKKIYEAPMVDIIEIKSDSNTNLTVSYGQTTFNKNSALGIGSGNLIDF